MSFWWVELCYFEDNPRQLYNGFEHLIFAKMCSLFPSQINYSIQLGTEKEHLLRKLKYHMETNSMSYNANNSFYEYCKQVYSISK